MAKTIDDYKKDYADAAARGDAAGMKAANDGANAIRASLGQAQEHATSDINKVASGGTSGMVSNPGRYDSGGVSSGSSGGSSGGGSKGMYDTTPTPVPWDGSAPKITQLSYGNGNGNSLVTSGVGGSTYEEKLASASKMYNEAKARGDWQGMLQANTWANQLRNEQGQAAQWAYEDINRVKGQQTVGQMFGPTGQSGYGTQQNPYQQQDNYYAQLLEEQKRQYDEIQAKQEAAKKAAVEQAVGQLSGQKSTLEQNYQDLYRQLYLQRRNAEKNLPQQMAAMGYNGGLTESSALNLQTSYADAMRQGEIAKQGTMSEIDRAIADARLSGDISIAEQAAQLAKDRLAAYGSTIDAMQQQANWAAQFGYQQEQDSRNFLYQAGRDQIADNRYTQEWTRQQLLNEISREDTTYERKVQAAQYLYENTGDPSLFTVIGYTPEQIAALRSSYAAAMAGSGSVSGGSTNSSGGSKSSTVEDYDGLYAAAYASRNPQNFISSNYKKYGFSSSSGLYSGYTDWREGEADNGQRIYKNDFSTLVSYTKKMQDFGRSPEYMVDALRKQGYTDAVIDQVFAALGL